MKNKRKTKGNNFLQEKKEIIYFVLYSLNFVYEFFFSSTDNYCPFADLQYNGILLGLPKHVIIYKIERKSMTNFVKI